MSDFSIPPQGTLLERAARNIQIDLWSWESGQFSWNLEGLRYTSKRVRVPKHAGKCGCGQEEGIG